MDDRTALLLAWLEGEGERQRRPLLPPPHAKDLALRGWVQVGVCVLGGALAAALFVCWLDTTRERAVRVAFEERLRLLGIREVTGGPNEPGWWKEAEVAAKRDGGALEIFLFAAMFKVAIGTLIGTVFLRAACAFYNNLTGGEGSLSSVPRPLLSTAIGITFVTTLVNAVVGFVIGLLVGAGGSAPGAGERGATILVQLLSLPVSLLVLAGMNSALLPTSFSRGFLVALCYLLVGLFVVAILAVIVGGFFLVVSLLR